MARVLASSARADLGCANIGIALWAIDPNPHNYPKYSLKDDPALRREMKAALRHRDVTISIGEGFIIRPGRDVTELADDLAIMAELGARRINSASMDPDMDRSVDQLGALVTATKRGD